jgi:hypothetical protein
MGKVAGSDNRRAHESSVLKAFIGILVEPIVIQYAICIETKQDPLLRSAGLA